MRLENFSKIDPIKSDISASKFDPGKKLEPVKNLDSNQKKSETFDPGKRLEPVKELDSNQRKLETFDPGKKLEINDRFSERREEWIKHTPKENTERGEWTGERGDSKFIPYNDEVKAALKEYKIDGIEYKDGIPDFSKVAKETVRIQMTEDRHNNFAQCDMKCAEKWNQEGHDGRTNWTPRQVESWRKSNNYSWHERVDMSTCDLVDRTIHNFFGHSGGVSECKNQGGESDV